VVALCRHLAVAVAAAKPVAANAGAAAATLANRVRLGFCALMSDADLEPDLLQQEPISGRTRPLQLRTKAALQLTPQRRSSLGGCDLDLPAKTVRAPTLPFVSSQGVLHFPIVVVCAAEDAIDPKFRRDCEAKSKTYKQLLESTPECRAILQNADAGLVKELFTLRKPRATICTTDDTVEHCFLSNRFRRYR
jgi:hypothetical protein